MTYCFDASASIPTSTPSGCTAVLGYLNSKEAADPWTLDDWLRFGHLRQFPAWVAELYGGAPSAQSQATSAVLQAKALGWHEGRAIVADMEAVADVAWWHDWSAEVRRLGFVPVWYGSRSAQPSAAAADWRWLAEPDGVASIPDGYQAKQFKWGVTDAGGVIDLSVISGDLHKHGGEGPRHRPGAAASVRAAVARIFPHTTAPVAQTGDTPVSGVVQKIHQFIDDHEAELETLLGDAAAVLPEPVGAGIAEAVRILSALTPPATVSEPVTPAPSADVPAPPSGASDAA